MLLKPNLRFIKTYRKNIQTMTVSDLKVKLTFGTKDTIGKVTT